MTGPSHLRAAHSAAKEGRQGKPRAYLSRPDARDLRCSMPTAYPAFLLVLGTQLTAGPVLGFLSGAAFGASREAMALAPLFVERYRLDPPAMMTVLQGFQAGLQRFNLMLVVGGGLLLITSVLKII